MVLGMLLRQDCVLPNLYVGTLTRDKFLESLDMGLTAADITTFLQQHAHPQVSRRVPSVPEVGTCEACIQPAGQQPDIMASFYCRSM